MMRVLMYSSVLDVRNVTSHLTKVTAGSESAYPKSSSSYTNFELLGMFLYVFAALYTSAMIHQLFMYFRNAALLPRVKHLASGNRKIVGFWGRP